MIAQFCGAGRKAARQGEIKVSTILGTAGADTLNGTNGNDTINGNLGFDSIRPGNGNDRINGGPGDANNGLDYRNVSFGLNFRVDGGKGTVTGASKSDSFLQYHPVRGNAPQRHLRLGGPDQGGVVFVHPGQGP